MAVAMGNNAHISDQETIRNVSKTRKMFKQPGTFNQAVLNVISTPLEEGLSESTAVLVTALGILNVSRTVSDDSTEFSHQHFHLH